MLDGSVVEQQTIISGEDWADRLFRPHAGEGIYLDRANRAIDLYIGIKFAPYQLAAEEDTYNKLGLNKQTAIEALRVIRNQELARPQQDEDGRLTPLTNEQVAAVPELSDDQQRLEFIDTLSQALNKRNDELLPVRKEGGEVADNRTMEEQNLLRIKRNVLGKLSRAIQQGQV